MHYELWDTETRNLVEDFDGEDEALVAADELIELNPAMYPSTLALARQNDDGTTSWLADGALLGQCVEAHRASAKSRIG